MASALWMKMWKMNCKKAESEDHISIRMKAADKGYFHLWENLDEKDLSFSVVPLQTCEWQEKPLFNYIAFIIKENDYL